jgi:hypothetical protein
MGGAARRQTMYPIVSRKKRSGVRSRGVRKSFFVWMNSVALVLWLAGAGGETAAQTKTATSRMQRSHRARTCKKDSECPSGQRCGFTFGCRNKGKCVVPTGDSHCVNPGGRCGCDGLPVDIFCAVGSTTEYTSAPANAVGPCPRPCTAELGCGPSDLVCENGFCLKPRSSVHACRAK